MAAGDIILASDFKIGTIAKARRTTPSAATVTAEVGYLRIDNVQLFLGRDYRIWTSPMNCKGSVVGDVIDIRLRASNAGTATTASSQISHIRDFVDNATFTNLKPLTALYTPGASTTTASFLLTVARSVVGAGSTGVQLFASGTETVDLVIEDVGPALADSGVSL